jgi:group I intron endonuclease
MAFIYKITNLINGKKYIGETTLKDPSKRWVGHLRAIHQGKGCPLLRKAVEKYGKDNFKFEVICECSLEERYEKEKEYITSENSIVPNGYNATAGGAGGGFIGKKHSEETIVKMRDSIKKVYSEMSDEKRKEMYSNRKKSKGFKISEATKKKLSERMKSHTVSEETRHKVSESLKKYHSSIKTKAQTEETRHKISEAAKKRIENSTPMKYSDEMKQKHSEVMTKATGVKVDQYSLDGIFIQTFASKKLAAKETGAHPASINKVITGKNKTAGGFLWKLHIDEAAEVNLPTL